jgi:hypothetical protein
MNQRKTVILCPKCSRGVTVAENGPHKGEHDNKQKNVNEVITFCIYLVCHGGQGWESSVLSIYGLFSSKLVW